MARKAATRSRGKPKSEGQKSSKQSQIPRLSPKEFGALMGVTDDAVRRAIRDGRLSDSVIHEDHGRRSYALIDAEAGTKEWQANTRTRVDLPPVVAPEDLDPGPPQPEVLDGEEPPVGPIIYADERARKERELADKYQLENEIRRGNLVEREEMVRLLYGLGRLMRDGLSTLPATLSPELATMFDDKEIAILLERELAEILQEMTDQAEKFIFADGNTEESEDSEAA